MYRFLSMPFGSVHGHPHINQVRSCTNLHSCNNLRVRIISSSSHLSLSLLVPPSLFFLFQLSVQLQFWLTRKSRRALQWSNLATWDSDLYSSIVQDSCCRSAGPRRSGRMLLRSSTCNPSYHRRSSFQECKGRLFWLLDYWLSWLIERYCFLNC